MDLNFHIDKNNSLILENPPKKAGKLWVEYDRDLWVECDRDLSETMLPRMSTNFIVGQNDYSLTPKQVGKILRVWVDN